VPPSIDTLHVGIERTDDVDPELLGWLMRAPAPITTASASAPTMLDGRSKQKRERFRLRELTTMAHGPPRFELVERTLVITPDLERRQVGLDGHIERELERGATDEVGHRGCMAFREIREFQESPPP
jgi:hypothetical protein